LPKNAAYPSGNRWQRHDTPKWIFIGVGVALLGLFLEQVLDRGVGGDLVVLAIFAVMDLSIAGVINSFNHLIGRYAASTV
jgi:hypothetical protein